MENIMVSCSQKGRRKNRQKGAQLIAAMFAALVFPGTVCGQIATDGSVGQATNLSGPDYVIPDSLGAQKGSNLFHSFSSFNINSGESATFTSSHSGPTANVISRVTGASPSHIDGLLQSNIATANLWLINPNGVVFGANASLNVPGSFHVSTADYLQLQDGGRYGANLSNAGNTLLTIAPPSAFGFLSDNISAISITSTELIDTSLELSAGKTLSVIGRLENDSSGESTSSAIDGVVLHAPGGTINLVSVNSPGLVSLDEESKAVASLNGFEELGAIDMANTTVSVKGESGGEVFIRGGRFTLSGSTIDAGETGSRAAGTIDIQAENLRMLDQSRITASNVDGQGGHISLLVGDLEVTGESHIEADSNGSAEAGSVVIVAIDPNTEDLVDSGTVSVRGFSSIRSNANSSGNAGSVDIVAEQVNIAEAFIMRVTSPDPLEFSYDFDKGIQSSSSATGPDAGAAGKVSITARQIQLESGSDCIGLCLPIPEINFDGALIGGGVIAAGSVDGGGGEVRLRVESLDVDYGGMVVVGASGSGGKAYLLIEGFESTDQQSTAANTVSLQGNGFDFIPEDVDAQIAEVLQVGGKRFTGILAAGQYTGSAGDVDIIAESISVDQGSFILSSATDGEAGDINIQVENLLLAGGSSIKAGSEGISDGGLINIRGIDDNNAHNPANSVWVDTHSSITSSSDSENADSGAGGNIDIVSRSIKLTAYSRIHAVLENGEGKVGGTVNLFVDELYLEASKIQTDTYGFGNAGDITVSGATQNAAKSVSLIGIEGEGGIMSRSRHTGSHDEHWGSSGVISVTTEKLVVDDNWISARATGGAGGSINVKANRVILSNGGQLNADTYQRGDGGNIVVTGIGSSPLELDVIGADSGIYSESKSNEYQAGAAGTIMISADSLSLRESAEISVATIEGRGGSITLNIADQLALEEGARVIANTKGSGDAGDINIGGQADIDIRGSEISSSSISKGRAGGITIDMQENTIKLTDGASISVSSTAVQGQAGNVDLFAKKLIMDDSRINAQALAAGALSGNVNLEVDGIVHLVNSVISGESASAEASGGNFTLIHPELLLLQEGSLIRGSSASESGGNVRIEADSIVMDTTSTVQASGDLFTAGSELHNVVQLEAPQLPEVGDELQTICTPQQIKNRSTLFVDLIREDAAQDRYELSWNDDPAVIAAQRQKTMGVACRY